jgi:secondary thiamine-phosphate synthase enzyme
MDSRAAIRVLRDDEGAARALPPRVVRSGGVIFWAQTLVMRTDDAPQFLGITDSVEATVARSGIRQGWVSVFSKHTTAAVVINENEPLLIKDLGSLLERMSAVDADYQHNDLSRRSGEVAPDECANGHAHCQHLLLGSSQNIPVADGRMDLGRWQRVFFVELDRPRDRQVVVQVFGA